MRTDADTHRKPRTRLLLLGILALAMGIGGLRFTYYTRMMFDQNTQTYVETSGKVSNGPRPWPEPWLLAYGMAASGLMLIGGVGLLARRPWALMLTGLAGLAWSISGIGYLFSTSWFYERVRERLPVVRDPRWFLEAGIGVAVLCVGILFVTVYWRPRWAGVAGRPGSKRVALLAFVAWGLISVAASTIFTRWLLSLI